MLREEYLRRLIDEAFIEIYLSANDNARIYWPWRMHPPKEANLDYRNACEKYIIDSDPEDNDVTNEDVLDTAFKLDAEVASLADVYQDKDATVDTLLEGLETYDDHVFDGEIVLPLQEPYVECYTEIGEPKDHILGIGGLKKGSPDKRIQVAKELRNHVGNDVWIHGFGWGVSDELAKSIRANPNLLDSTDYSSPVQSAPYNQTNGQERSSVIAAYAGARLIRDLREVSSYAVGESPEDLRPETQTTII